MAIAASNQDQATYWNGPGADRWVKGQEALDPSLRVFSDPALAAGHPSPGEAVIDVGCGCGDTSLILAERVGPKGNVLGLDVSGPMLARARERAHAAGRTNVTFAEGDATIAPLPPAAFDLLFSRFGVMFFADPKASFEHLHEALKPTGRVSFVCWRKLAENPWASVPQVATVSVVGAPPPQPPDAPGPFSFGDPARLRAVLEGAGFHDVTLAPFDTTMRMGLTERPTLDEAAEYAMRLGPAARLLIDKDEETLGRARVAIRAALAAHLRDEGVQLAAATWVVTAKRG
jgi:SAM-dependent methyltransferase